MTNIKLCPTTTTHRKLEPLFFGSRGQESKIIHVFFPEDEPIQQHQTKHVLQSEFHSAPSLPMIARKNMSARNLWHTGTLTFGIVLNRILCVVLLLMFAFVDSQQKIDVSIPRKVFLTLCHHCAMPCVGRQKSNIRLSI